MNDLRLAALEQHVCQLLQFSRPCLLQRFPFSDDNDNDNDNDGGNDNDNDNDGGNYVNFDISKSMPDSPDGPLPRRQPMAVFNEATLAFNHPIV